MHVMNLRHSTLLIAHGTTDKAELFQAYYSLLLYNVYTLD